MAEELLLTITMLVSDREDTIEKCMESIKPLLDGIPSELIVVDTAGNRKCMDIVRHYTDKIVRFEWCNDFAAARNAGLAKAKGRWVMYMDDDEWFEDVSEIKDFFLKGIYKKYKSAAYLTRNYSDKEGLGYNDRIAVRLCRLEKDTRFEGKIHEQLSPLYEPAYYMKAYVHHYGYVYESEEARRQHAWRNIKLLTEARAAEADNWKAGAHLIQEYNGVGEYYSLIAVARDMRLKEGSYDIDRNNFTSYAAVREVEAYVKLKRYEEAYTVGKELLYEPRTQLLCKLCMASLMAEVSIKLQKENDEIAEYIELYKKFRELWEKNPEKYEVHDLFNMSSAYLGAAKQSSLGLIELYVLVKEKAWDAAAEVFEKIGWADLTEILSNTFHDIIKLIAHSEYRSIYAIALEILFEGERAGGYLCESIDKAEDEEKEKVLYCIAQIPSEKLVILRYHLEYAFLTEDVDKVREILNIWKEKNYSFFLPEKDYWRGLSRLRLGLSEWLGDVRIHEWITLSEALFEQMPEESCENVYQVLARGLKNTDIRFLHLTALQLEKRLLARDWQRGERDASEMEELWREMYRIASLWVSCAASLYRDDVFRGGLQSALPPRYQFAWLIFQANAVRTEPFSFVRKIAEAAKAYLRMEKVCKCILQYYKAEADE